MDDQRYAATKQEQTSSNGTLFVRRFRLFRRARAAHDGLLGGRAKQCWSSGNSEALLGEQISYEFIPFQHSLALLWHVVPSVVALRTHILKRVVLKAVANFLRHTGLSSERLPRPA